MRSPADLLSRPRLLHPLAWWGWGLLCAAAASRTTNPWYLLTLIGAVVLVVLQRRELGSPVGLGLFLRLALLAVLLRVLAAVVFGAGQAGSVLLELPSVQLPDWFSGVTLGGPIRTDAVLLALEQGLQLAAIVVCFGACNVLADPRRLLRFLPATLNDIGTALVVGLSLAPALATRAGQVRAAKRLRGESATGWRALGDTITGTVEGALERSLDLAAAMESRGYGRNETSARDRTTATALTATGLVGVTIGLFGLLNGAAPTALGWPVLACGLLLLAAALAFGPARRTAYRREPWARSEWAVLSCAAAAVLTLLLATGRPWALLAAADDPSYLPGASPVLLAALLLPALAGVLAPRTPLRAEVEDRVALNRLGVSA
ncbi:energy-coupling factor transporter transmembrane component T [Dermacoccaceae bacterium W4C1]